MANTVGFLTHEMGSGAENGVRFGENGVLVILDQRLEQQRGRDSCDI